MVWRKCSAQRDPTACPRVNTTLKKLMPMSLNGSYGLPFNNKQYFNTFHYNSGTINRYLSRVQITP